MNSNSISSGLIGFDRITGGLALGQLITITGRPAMGKTAFAITLMMNIGLKQQIPVAFFSIEMSNAQIGKRILKNWASDDFNISAENSEDIEQINYKQLLYKLYKAPIFLDDTPIISIDEIEDKIVNLISKYGVKVVIIEYLQLIKDFAVNPDDIMTRLKALAVEKEICIIFLSQLYNKLNPSETFEFDDSLFKAGTNAIMNNCVIVAILYRPCFYNKSEPDSLAEMRFLKGNKGKNNPIRLSFLPYFSKFTDFYFDDKDSRKSYVVDVIRNLHELEEYQRKISLFNKKEKYMIRSSVKELMCEDARLEQLMNIPISEILHYRDMADSIDPEDALRFLADRFIDNCGVSLGMRGFYDYCANYWLKKLDLENNPVLNKKYHEAQTLGQILPYISSDKYYEGLLDEYDSCVMDAVELRDDLIYLLEQEDDEKIKIILCAGICHCLSVANDGLRWLDQFSNEDIEQGIINFQNRTLIRRRHQDDFQRYRTWQHIKVTDDTPKGLRRLVERWPDEFTEEEVAHFVILNDRLVELQHEVLEQVKVITANLQEQIAKGVHQYDTFCIEGGIYIEPFEEDSENELLETLCLLAKYKVIFTNDNTTPEHIAEEISEDRHWYANWSGIFHQLEKSHGLKLCNAFRYLFEEGGIFTISDIMKIKPEMLLPHVKINI